jgi:PAS domain S-box-containing protein
MAAKVPTKQELLAEVADLRQRMTEAEDILRAIRDYEVDALVVRAPQGEQVVALETADAAYRQMVEQMREGAATLTPAGVVLFGNQPLARLLGCPPQQIVGEPFINFMPDADRPRLAALLATHEGGRTASHIQNATGVRIPVSFSASRMLVDEQPVVLLLVTDLTYEKQADRVARLLRLATRLSVALTPAQAAEAVVNGALRAFDADDAFVAVPAEGESYLRIAHAVGYTPERLSDLEQLPLRVGQPVSDAIRLRDLVVVESAAECQQRYPHWPPPTPQGSVGALLALPLLLPNRLLGVLQLGFSSAHSVELDDRDFALTVAQQCAQALERASLYRELEQRVQARTAELQSANALLAEANQQLTEEIAERRATQRQLDRLREEERTRVARELHDELGGGLTVLKMDIGRLLKDAALPEPVCAQLREMSDAVDGAIESMRRLATELRPLTLDDLGLEAALDVHFQEFLRRSGLNGEFVSAVEGLALPEEAALACFRIFQEALTNVARHAEATRVTASLEQQAEGLVLSVTDNGRGMRLPDGHARGHLGLVGMQERAAQLGARLKFISAPGQGTTVLLQLPGSLLAS